jgi:hypothetical protein
VGGTRGCRCSGDNGLEQSEAPKRRKEMARINGSTAHRRRAAIFFVCGVRTCVLCVRVVSIGCQTLAGLAALTNDQRLCMGRRYIAPGRSRQRCMHACMQSREKRATPRKVRRSIAVSTDELKSTGRDTGSSWAVPWYGTTSRSMC